MAPAIQNDILRQWLDMTTLGGEVKLEVGNIAFGDAVKLQKAIEGFKEVTPPVTRDFANQIATYTIQTTLSADKLAERLVDAKVGDKTLDITDTTANVIKGKLK